MASGKEIIAKLKLDSKDFQKGISDSQKSLIALSATVTALGATVLAVTKMTANYNDEMIKSARAAGESAESFSALSHAATMAGASQEELGKALIKLNSQSPNVTKALNELGISVRDANGNLKQGSALLGDVADRMQKSGNAATKTAIAVKVFGDEGTKLVSMLGNGAKGLAAATKEAEALGLVVSERAGKAAEKFNDDMALTVKTLGGLSRAIGESVIEFMNQSNALGFVREIVSSITRFWRGLSDETKNTIINAALMTTVIGGVVLAIGILIALKPQITSFFATIRAGINLATFGIAGLIASLVALAGAFVKYWDQIKSVFDPMLQSFSDLVSTVKSVKKAVSDAFTFDSSPAAKNLDSIQSKFQQTWEKMSLLGTVAKAVAATVAAAIQTIITPIKILADEIKAVVDIAKMRIDQVKALADGSMTNFLKIQGKIFEKEKEMAGKTAKTWENYLKEVGRVTDVIVLKTPDIKTPDAVKETQKTITSVNALNKNYGDLEETINKLSEAQTRFNRASADGSVSTKDSWYSAQRVLEDVVNGINAVTQKIVGYASTAISAFSGLSDAISAGIKSRFEKEDRERQVAILKFTKSIEARIKATEESENKRLEALSAQFDKEIAMLQAQEDAKIAVLEKGMNERLLLQDAEYQAAKEKAEREHAAFMQAESERYETEKELLLQKAVDKEQRQLVETEMDEGFRQYRLMLEQQFQQSQTELAKTYADNRKNNEAINKEQIKAIETNSKAQIEALTKQKNETLKKEEEEKNKKLKALEEEKNSTLTRLEKERTQKKWESEVAQFRATKAAKTAEIIASSIASAAMAFATMSALGPIGMGIGAAIAAVILSTGYMRVSELQGQEPIKPAELSLGSGGLLGGNFSHASGNDIPARLESQELVIDKARTKQMFDALDNNALGGKKEINVYFEKGSIQTYDISDESVIDKLSFAVVRRVEQAGGFA